MKIQKVTITNFKSIYGTQEFDFNDLNGLVKLSGPIGVGKTSVGEAILYGLYGAIKGQNVPNLVSWNCKECEVDIEMISKGKQVKIIRNIRQPLVVEVDGKTVSASNKRNTQEILEEEIFDVPKLAIQKMCVISFNAFNSLASMSAGETKEFLDEIFGFKLFTEYNDEVIIERKAQQNENVKLNAIYNETKSQIGYLQNKKEEQQNQLANTVDIDSLRKKRDELVEQGRSLKIKYTETDSEYTTKESDLHKVYLQYYNQKMEYATLGKQVKEWVKKFGTGKCPTCGHTIDETVIAEHNAKLHEYADLYKKEEAKEKEISTQINELKNEHRQALDKLVDEMNKLKKDINSIDSDITVYNNNLKLINENYNDLIAEYEIKAENIKEQLDKSDLEIGEWNEMNELFTKTLRYSLLETLIPHINRSIKYYINKLDQPYKIEYDQEFKAHIYIDTFDKEISYSSLSTGQKKSLDMAIIFGVLQNIITNVDFNIFFLDELFSNLDSDARNIMLSLLKETLGDNRTIFVINHAEMNDDYFNHKIRVSIENRKITSKKKEEIVVKASKYTTVF